MSTTLDTPQSVIDELTRVYVSWREVSVAVQVAYDRWSTATSSTRAEAFAAFSLALNREEAAARTYADLYERSWLLIASETPS